MSTLSQKDANKLANEWLREDSRPFPAAQKRIRKRGTNANEAVRVRSIGYISVDGFTEVVRLVFSRDDGKLLRAKDRRDVVPNHAWPAETKI
jgi:hypothetical protein